MCGWPHIVRLFVKSYADRENIVLPRFKNNLPGEDWANKFVKDHKMTKRIATNIKEVRAKVSKKDLEVYMANLEPVIEGVPPENIVNYDETNLTDDPGSQNVICRRVTKRVERVMNTSKTSTSIMFSGTASGHMLPVYTVYKAKNIYPAWVERADHSWRFNRTDSGWFDQRRFEDWFEYIIIPYFRKLKGKKIIIGDNLASHLSPRVIDLC